MAFLLKLLFGLFVAISVCLVGSEGSWMPEANVAGVVCVIVAIVIGTIFELPN